MTDLPTDIMGGKPLATDAEIKDSAGLKNSPNISPTFITTYNKKASADVRTYVSGRYDLKSFTRSRFTDSPAAEMLKGMQMLIASAYIMAEGYGNQRLEEENGSKTKFDQQIAMLVDIRSGLTRLLDNSLEEFDLLPLGPKNTTPKNIGNSFDKAPANTFHVADKW